MALKFDHEFIIRIWRDGDGNIHDFSKGIPLIRCRDCLYWEDEDYCLHWQRSPYIAPCTEPDDFCSYAEKRVD